MEETNDIIESQDEDVLNPIEEDQAYEISTLHPDEANIDGLTSYDAVNEVAETIEDNGRSNNQVEELAKTLSVVDQELPLKEKIEVAQESLRYAFESLGSTLLTISTESIEEHPEETLRVLESETQALQDKAEEKVWSTVREDTSNIIKLIDLTLETISKSKPVLDKALKALKKGKLESSMLNLKEHSDVIGSYRYFLKDIEDKGNLEQLLTLMSIVLNESTPKLTSKDNTVLNSLNDQETDGVLAVKEHILEAITTDPLNIRLSTIVKSMPNRSDYSFYSRVTGNKDIAVLNNNKPTKVEVEDTYVNYVVDSKHTDIEALKINLTETLKNFETRFRNLFIIYKKKYEQLEKSLQPITSTYQNEINNDKRDRLLTLTNIVRYYYIDVVKNRVLDKLNTYLTMLDIVQMMFIVDAKDEPEVDVNTSDDGKTVKVKVSKETSDAS